MQIPYTDKDQYNNALTCQYQQQWNVSSKAQLQAQAIIAAILAGGKGGLNPVQPLGNMTLTGGNDSDCLGPCATCLTNGIKLGGTSVKCASAIGTPVPAPCEIGLVSSIN